MLVETGNAHFSHWTRVDVRGWQYDMCGHTRGCVEYFCHVANYDQKNFRVVTTPNLDNHEIDPAELEIRGELASECASVVLKYFIRSE